MPILIVQCSCPANGSADSIAKALVDERLAACVQVLPGMRSTYTWQGLTQTDDEVLMLIKTTLAGFEVLKARLLELHPYELPEIIGVDVRVAHADYVDWVESRVGVP